MFKNKVYIFIYLSMMLPVFLSAAPIDKYYVPPVQQYAPQQQAPNYKKSIDASNIYSDFERKVSSLSPIQKRELKESFQKKMDNAANNKNYEAAAYYQQLINILDRLMDTQ